MKKMWNRHPVIFIAIFGLVIGVYITLKPRRTDPPKIPVATEHQEEDRKIFRYLGKEYVLPVKAEKIVVTGALEALEDLLALKVQPAGAMTIGGSFPPLFTAILRDAKPIGERTQPNLEAILKLQPDVILSSDKFPAATAEQLQKIAPTIPISHFPDDGAANLRLLGELTGKQALAEELLKEYQTSLAAAKARLPEKVKDQKVVAVRIRAGNISVYPPQLFFNDLLYTDLGLPVPEELKTAKTQEVISLEKFSAMDPDYIFVQYAVAESPAHPKILDELRQNPVWRNMKAVKNGHVFINVVDPLLQGVSFGGKLEFLKAAVAKLSEE
ncbi:iron complex transport system substrate-binding protein [Hydrogenispora ethanolica]|uniref:Iron complex transport system substrate-binding protein n=2 Tax=Hydrogenispora ethanolica TaxID=1082276 RepID=A0A4R1RVK7_HYDET|nr:iron complex transport system substrate-binding protein [Hydrogenispora ethanolica]